MNLTKLLPLTLLATLLGTGCAYHRTAESAFNPDTKTYDKTTFTGLVFFNRTAVSGLTVGKRSGTSSTTLSISKAATETQAEAIAALTEAAVKGAVKGALPIP